MFKEIFTEATSPDEILKKFGYKFSETETENKQSIWKVYLNPKANEDMYSQAVGELLKKIKGIIVVNSGTKYIKVQVDNAGNLKLRN